VVTSNPSTSAKAPPAALPSTCVGSVIIPRFSLLARSEPLGPDGRWLMPLLDQRGGRRFHKSRWAANVDAPPAGGRPLRQSEVSGADPAGWPSGLRRGRAGVDQRDLEPVTFALEAVQLLGVV